MEVGKAVLALNFVNPQANLTERMILILLEVSEGDLEDTSLERIVRVLETSRAVHKSLANTRNPSDIARVLGFACGIRLGIELTLERRKAQGPIRAVSDIFHASPTGCALMIVSYLDGVPVLAREGVHGLLLQALLALGESLVPVEGQ